MADERHSVSTADPSDREDRNGTPVSVPARRATVVAVLVVGVMVFTVTAVLSGTGASLPGLESSVIDEDSPSHRVFFENQRGQTLWVYDVWVADTGPERYQGLSGTESLPADTGLRFVYDQETADRAVVMREMYYPIDVVFIDGSGTVTENQRESPALQGGNKSGKRRIDRSR